MTLRAIPFAMCVGLFAFAGAVVFLSVGRPPMPPQRSDLILSGITAFAFVSSWTAAAFIERRPLPSDLNESFGALQTKVVVGCALREGAALLGLITCLIAGRAGALAAQPLLALNALPAVLFVLFVWRAWPTAERVEEALRQAGVPL